MNTWWKIYFWIVLIACFGIYSYTAANSPKIGDLVSLLIAVVSITGLYSYVYKKPIVSVSFWKSFFWIYIIYTLLEIFYPYTPLNSLVPISELYGNSTNATPPYDLITSLMILVLVSPLAFPQFYALYKLGSQKK